MSFPFGDQVGLVPFTFRQCRFEPSTCMKQISSWLEKTISPLPMASVGLGMLVLVVGVVGITVGLGVSVGPKNCPGRQAEISEFDKRNKIIKARCFIFIQSLEIVSITEISRPNYFLCRQTSAAVARTATTAMKLWLALMPPSMEASRRRKSSRKRPTG